MKIPSMENWREFLLRKGYDEGYEKGLSEVKIEKVVDTEEMDRRVQDLQTKHERALADLRTSYEGKIRRLNEVYENRRDLDADNNAQLQTKIEKLQKKNN